MRGRRIEGIEGLRALAAFSVLAWHVWAHPVTGSRSAAAFGSDEYGTDFGPLSHALDTLRVGVAMFFVLSGFLLFAPFASAILRGGPLPSIRDYLVNRTLRIVPAFWAILLLIAIFWQHDLFRHPLQLLGDMAFLQDYIPAYQPEWQTGAGIMPAWSLCVEVVFYVALPLLSVATVFLGRRRGIEGVRLALLPIALLGAVGLFSTELYRGWLTDPLFETSFFTHAHWFAIGMAVAVVRILWEDGRLRLVDGWRVAAGAAIVVLALLAVGGYAKSKLDFLEEQTILALACGLLVATIAMAKPGSRLVRALESRPLVIGGLLSYGVFLWHEPIFRFYRSHGFTWDGQAGYMADLLLVAMTATVFAAATYVLVERPALRHKRRARPAPVPVAAAADAAPRGQRRRHRTAA